METLQAFEVAWFAVIVCVIMGVMAVAASRYLIAVLFLVLAAVSLNLYFVLLST